MNITVFYESHAKQKEGKALRFYPAGLQAELADALEKIDGANIKIALQQDPENGLSDAVLNDTDVLIWWGADWQDCVLDDVANRVYRRVQEGMGAIFLHASAFSKPFKKLMGTDCSCKWRNNGERERVWCLMPTHPIAAGIPENFLLEQETMYGEPFEIPRPDETVFLSWFEGGEVLRSGLTFLRGKGKIFYFQPGSATSPTLLNPTVKQIIRNAVLWAQPAALTYTTGQVNKTPEQKKFGFFRR